LTGPSLLVFALSSVTVESEALRRGGTGDLRAGAEDIEAFEDILAGFEGSLEPLGGGTWLRLSGLGEKVAATGD
jgi:hypothetical protein